MPPRPQRSFQQYQSAPASSASSSAPAVNAFPVYRPPPPSSAASAAASSSASRRSPSPDPDRLAHFTVTAYEADLVYGQPELARTLEQRRDGAPGSKGRLVKHASAGLRDGDGGNNDDGEGVWIDRFSHLNLLSSLPPTSQPSAPASPASDWSSLPSDAEDTFFFTDDEGGDYERHKKRRRLDEMRAKRMEQLEPLDEPQQADADVWGGDDEVPSGTIHTLMKHTFVSLSASPNPALLEMRILANHGADKRFEFLRGRYADAWRDVKNPPKAEPTAAIGSLLGGYESSEDKSADEGAGDAAPSAGAGEAKPAVTEASADGPQEAPAGETEKEAKKRLRREKARLWAEKRRAGQE